MLELTPSLNPWFPMNMDLNVVNLQAQEITITSCDVDINTQGAKLQADNITLDTARDLNLCDKR
jgi:lipopolysaccharide assembly outer membrane protein LptD (OstA)